MKIYRKKEANATAGKFMHQLSLCTKKSSYHVNIDRKGKGFNELGRIFYKKMLVEKDFQWLKEMMELYESIIK